MAKVGGDYFSFSAPAVNRTQAPAAAAGGQDGPAEMVVKAGDTLSSIARQNKISLQQLKELNPELFKDGKDAGGKKRAADGHWIYPGDKIKLRPAAAGTAPLTPAGGTAPLTKDSSTTSAAAQTRYGGYGTDSAAGSPSYASPGTDPKTGSAGYKSPGTDSKTGSSDYKSPGTDTRIGSSEYKSPGTDTRTRSAEYKSPGTGDRPAPTPPAAPPAAPSKPRDGAAPPQGGQGQNLEGQRFLLGAVHEQFSMVARYDGGLSKADMEFNVADRPGRAEILEDFDKYANDEGEVKKENLERWIQDVDRKLGRKPADPDASADPRKEKKVVNVIEKYYDKVAGNDGKVGKEDIRKNVADDMEGRDALIRHFDKLAPRGYMTKGDLEKIGKELDAGKTFGQIAAGK